MILGQQVDISKVVDQKEPSIQALHHRAVVVPQIQEPFYLLQKKLTILSLNSSIHQAF